VTGLRPDPERGEMPFLDHLEELRWRIIWSLVALVVGVGAAMVLLLNVDVIGWLERPILPYLGGHHLVYTHPGDPFQIILQASAALGLLLALPVVLYQLWAFIAPALYKHERGVALGVTGAAVLLFASGAALGYFVVLPLAIPWLMGFGGSALEPMITAGDYFGFVFSLVLAFGVAFELPVVILGRRGARHRHPRVPEPLPPPRHRRRGDHRRVPHARRLGVDDHRNGGAALPAV